MFVAVRRSDVALGRARLRRAVAGRTKLAGVRARRCCAAPLRSELDMLAVASESAC